MQCEVLECENLQESRGVCPHHLRRLIAGLVYENEGGVLVDHCTHGHELSGDNVRWEPSVGPGRRRRCRTCLRARSRRRSKRAQEKVEPPVPYRPNDKSLSRAIDDFEIAKGEVDGKCKSNPGPWMDWEEAPTPEAARAMCNGCPLLKACGNYALAANEWHGVWGGLVIDEGKVLQ